MTAQREDLPQIRAAAAAAYQRISLDKAGDEHGVANQFADQQRVAAARGYSIAPGHVYTDNDLSASTGKARPGYEAMMAAAARGEFGVILVFQTSRLWRNRRERAEGIEVLRRAAISVVATKGPSLDMSTAYGRAMAGLLGEFDTMETEVKGERQRLAESERAAAGKRRTGTPRPFGYDDDHVTARPAEADAIRWAADALLGGGTVSGAVREWNRRGLLTPQGGKPFTRQSVTTILRNPRLAGLAVYKGEILPGVTGQWEAVLTEAQWRAVSALLGDPGRKPPRGRYTLLGGLATCRCATRVVAGPNARGTQVYRCSPALRGDTPGPHCQQQTANVDEFVEAVIVARLSRPDIADLITAPRPGPDTAALRREAASVRANLDELAADRALGLVSRAQMIAATARGNGRLDAIAAELAASAGTSVLAPFTAGEPARKVWDGLDLPRRRAVIDTLTPVIICPAGRGSRTFSPDTVQMPWRQP